MTLLHRLVSIARWIVRREQAERDLDAELRAFIELSAADKIRDGISPADARRLAVLEVGGVQQVKERVRAGRHGGTLDEIGRDIRYAFRMLARNPGFSAVVVVTLALGIGANTAIFSLIDALMLRSLPVRNPHELVQLTMRLPDAKGPAGDSFSYAIVRALADRKEIFAGVAGFTGYTFTAGSGESIRKVPGALVTGEYYETLGLTPASGRLLDAARRSAGRATRGGDQRPLLGARIWSPSRCRWAVAPAQRCTRHDRRRESARVRWRQRGIDGGHDGHDRGVRQRQPPDW